MDPVNEIWENQRFYGIGWCAAFALHMSQLKAVTVQLACSTEDLTSSWPRPHPIPARYPRPLWLCVTASEDKAALVPPTGSPRGFWRGRASAMPRATPSQSTSGRRRKTRWAGAWWFRLRPTSRAGNTRPSSSATPLRAFVCPSMTVQQRAAVLPTLACNLLWRQLFYIGLLRVYTIAHSPGLLISGLASWRSNSNIELWRCRGDHFDPGMMLTDCVAFAGTLTLRGRAAARRSASRTSCGAGAGGARTSPRGSCRRPPTSRRAGRPPSQPMRRYCMALACASTSPCLLQPVRPC